ncbi:hypothetical protein [Streptomyces sp. NPDC049916]|uniref:hypothetical protein n=1 Tax=Streptomyces sp. NPDC049916 TaxID=3155156 RepID=UPI003440292C
MSGSVIAVDVGTSGVRAAVITSGGQILASRHLPRGSGVRGDLFDCDTLHQEFLETIAALPAPPDCQALCIAAHIGTVAVDERLRPVGPGGGWADSRGVGELSARPQEVVRRLLRTAGRPTATAGAVACLLGLGARSVAGSRRFSRRRTSWWRG